MSHKKSWEKIFPDRGKSKLKSLNGRGMDWEFAISICKLLYIEWINNKVYSTGNCIQYPVINHNGKEYKKECAYICITESLCCTAEINTTL